VTLRLVVATANPDKAREIRAVLEAAGVDVELISRPEDVPEVEETGTTLVENARLKAEALRDATGVAAIGEDTGLEVDALGGAPGVRSGRYAGDDAIAAPTTSPSFSRRSMRYAAPRAPRGSALPSSSRCLIVASS
jgi:XTP/dITP diphosphohydrolase